MSNTIDVVLLGQQGIPGPPPLAILATAFDMPAVGSSTGQLSFTGSIQWMVVGQSVLVSGSPVVGTMTIATITQSGGVNVSATLTNSGANGNVAPGTAVPTGVSVGVSGPAGIGNLSFATLVSTSTSTAILAQTSVPCDCRTSNIFLTTPENPVANQEFEASDVYGAAGAPNTITVTAVGVGTTIANPAWNGSGSPLASVAILNQPQQIVRWRYNAPLNGWLLCA